MNQAACLRCTENASLSMENSERVAGSRKDSGDTKTTQPVPRPVRRLGTGARSRGSVSLEGDGTQILCLWSTSYLRFFVP